MLSGCLNALLFNIDMWLIPLVYGKRRSHRVSKWFSLLLSLTLIFWLATIISCIAMYEWLFLIIAILWFPLICVIWGYFVRKRPEDYYDYFKPEGVQVYKEPDAPIVFTSVSELANNEKIEDYHYTTLFIDGRLIKEGSKYFVVEILNEKEVARIELLFDGNIPALDMNIHRFKGTLIVENGRTLMQWVNRVY